MKEILVGVVGFLVACVRKSVLRLEALALVNRVVKLGISVAHLSAVNIKLKAFNQFGI